MREWTFSSRRSGYQRSVGLYLYPELDCSAAVDDYCHLDGEGQFEAYIDYLKGQHPEWLRADAVPILWSVLGGDICESAPFQSGQFAVSAEFGPRSHFLTYFTWPYNAATGEKLDWFKLPVRNDRFPKFAKALAWTPSPLQPTCPLSSIVASRSGFLPRRYVASGEDL